MHQIQKIKKLAIVINNKNAGAIEFSKDLATIAEGLGVEVKTTTSYPLDSEFLKNQDACCTIGGDGTILGTVRQAVKYDVPVLGIQFGKLGFMATLSPEQAIVELQDIIAGHYELEDRALLKCKNNAGIEVFALNDIVIKNVDSSRLIPLRVFADGQYVTQYSSDGLIFSTPTGSTAYNLSAGGPIIHTKAEVTAMTPICAHSLSNRPVIFSKDITLTVTCDHPNIRGIASIDGNFIFQPDNLFPLEINVATQKFPLIKTKSYSHFEVLRNKLKW
jgi:NAD+ kinase